MSTSKFLGSVAAVVGGHHVDVGVAQQLVDHLVAIVQMIGLWQWHRIGSFWRARETKALVCDTYHIHMFSNAGCFHTLILFHVVVKVGNTLVWSNSPQSPISTVRSEKEDLSKVNSFIFFSRKEDLSKQHLFS